MTTAGFATDDGVMGPRGDRPRRRSFTAEFKARVLSEYDAADREQRGAILRREGLYTSHIAEWRKAADAGARAALDSGGRVRPGRGKRDRELEALRARAEKAEAELARSRAALDLMGKAHALLETLSESAATDKRSRP